MLPDRRPFSHSRTGGAPTVEHKKAKDILRAARLERLPCDNAHVVSDLAKIKKGQPLSPIQLLPF